MMLELVRVTAPVPPRAALSTAKFDAAPRTGASAAAAGKALPSSAAAANRHVERVSLKIFHRQFFFRRCFRDCHETP
ncbi:hypothetical protein [Ottowia sp.]|uniref:hypothetical protein n=1 Tax=Ottowia sp. TaxID=1898956 RepID=UPI0025E3AF5F|nr:hypothetical protein [Ottowia sp.]MBK6613730.1 hypothetical protein [Ottowia sp.]